MFGIVWVYKRVMNTHSMIVGLFIILLLSHAHLSTYEEREKWWFYVKKV